MKQPEAHYVIDKLPFLSVLGGVFLIAIANTSFHEGNIELGILILIFAVLLIVIAPVFMPIYYRFDSSGVSIYYLFLHEERYLWSNVYSVTINDRSTTSVSLMNLFFREFRIGGKVEGKHRKYMCGNIPKNRKTESLIKKYWQGEIDGHLIDDIKDFMDDTKNFVTNIGAKKAMKSGNYSSENVARAERVARKQTQERIKPYISRFAMIDLELRCKFVYVTDNLDELNSRPKEKYEYTVSVEISRKGETNEDMILCVDATLLTVKLGKDEYVSTKRKGAYRDLTEELDTLLEEIEKTGFEAYCKGEVQ